MTSQEIEASCARARCAFSAVLCPSTARSIPAMAAVPASSQDIDAVVITETEFAQRLEAMAVTVSDMGEESMSWVMFCRAHETSVTLSRNLHEFQYQCIIRYSVLDDMLQGFDQALGQNRQSILSLAQSFVDDLQNQYVVLQPVVQSVIDGASGSNSDQPEEQ